jgi:hypothetical protein
MKSIQKPPSVIADVRPSGSAGDSATARLWIFLFRLFAVRACACLGERSEPTCIRQAHATVPKPLFQVNLARIKIDKQLKKQKNIQFSFTQKICYNSQII